MITAYTISQEPSKWYLPEIPWHNLVDNTPIDKYHGRTLEYVKYLAWKRNMAVTELLDRFPETMDVLCCDSYYVRQIDQLRQLVKDYAGNMVLGGSIYGPWRQRARDVFFPRRVFSDPWGVPDLAWTRPGMKGLIRSKGMTGIHLFPISAWRNGARYEAYEDTNEGTDNARFARNTGLDIWIDMDAMFYRERVYSRIKCLRCSLGIGTKLKRVLETIS